MVATGVCVGLGSHVAWDRRSMAVSGAAMLSIPAVKGVEIGMGFAAARATGADVHDEIEPAPPPGTPARGKCAASPIGLAGSKAG